MTTLANDDFETLIQRCRFYCADEVFADHLRTLRHIVHELNDSTYIVPTDPTSFNPASTGHLPDRGCIICYTPRSGSTLLAMALTNLTSKRLACFGYPGEVFNLGEIPARARHYGCRSLDDYARWALWESTDESGMLTVKGDLYQLLPFIFTPAFQSLIPSIKFVYLTREDILLQAISLVIAHHTGRWTSDSVVHGSYIADVDELASNIRMLTQMMGGWETVFVFSGIQPLRLTYEQLESNLDASIRKIASYLNISLPSTKLNLGLSLKPTRDEINYNLRFNVTERLSITSTYAS